MKNLVIILVLFTSSVLSGQNQIGSFDSTLKELVLADLEKSSDYINEFTIYGVDLVEIEEGLATFIFFPIHNSDQYSVLVNSLLYRSIEGKPVILINNKLTRQVDLSSLSFLALTTPKSIKFAQMLYPVVLGSISSERAPISFEVPIKN